MKLKSFTAKNFQSLDKFKINFNPKGVYIITGPNGTGKSALVNSMGAHFYNKLHQTYKKDYIRDNCSNFETESETYEGYKVYQSRGADNYYQVTTPDGVEEEPLFKLEKGVPERVQEIFNFYTDPISEEKLNFRENDSALMLVTTSPKETYDIFQYSIGNTELSESISAGDKLIRQNNNDMVALADQAERDIAERDSIKVVDLETLENSVEYMKSLDSALILCSKYIDASKELEEVNSKLTECTRLKGLFDQFREVSSVCKLLSSYISMSKELEVINTSLETDSTKLEHFKKLDSLKKTYEQVTRYIAYTKELDNLNSSIKNVDHSAEIAKCKQDLNSLVLCSKIIDLMGDFKEIKTDIQNCDQQKVKLTEQRTGLFKKYGYCPTCKTKFNSSYDIENHSHTEGGVS